MIYWITFGIFAACLVLEGFTSLMLIRGSNKKYTELWLYVSELILMGNSTKQFGSQVAPNSWG